MPVATVWAMELTDEEVRERITLDRRWSRVAAHLNMAQMRLLLELDRRNEVAARLDDRALAV